MLRFCTRNRLRQYCSGLGDGYQPLVFSALSSRNAGLESSTSGGKSGQIGGPSAFAVSRPLTNSSESRSCSALSRRGERSAKCSGGERWRLPIGGAGGDLPHELFDGPAVAARIRWRANRAARHLRAASRPGRNRSASQPAGGPSRLCQTRLTNTRAVSGFSGEAIQLASVSRRPVVLPLFDFAIVAGCGSNTERKPGLHRVARRLVIALEQDVRGGDVLRVVRHQQARA